MGSFPVGLHNCKMSSPLLMIPGPTEFHSDVLAAMAHKGMSHVSPHFIACFSEAIKQTREVYLAPDGQPIILSGSGTLGWDLITCNLVQPGEVVLVVNTGYFGDRWGECLQMYGAKVHHINAAPGDRPSVDQIVQAVRAHQSEVKMITFTHVDTSTGVRMNIKECAQAVRKIVPDILIAVDGVCALAGEELRMTEWDIDAYLTGSQKAIGVPAGLSITVFRPRAMRRFESLTSNANFSRNYYVNLQRWLPVMKAYEEKQPSYFATPAVNLVYALNVGYKILLANGGMEKRFQEHKNVATQFRQALRQLGYEFVPKEEDYAAYTMSAIKYPQFKSGKGPADFLQACIDNGAIFAGGLHKDIKSEYFRVGHMGVSSRTPEHIHQTVRAIERATEICAGTPSSKASDFIRSKL